MDSLNLSEEEKLVRAKNEENKAKMEEAQSDAVGDGKFILKYPYQDGKISSLLKNFKINQTKEYLSVLINLISTS